MSWQGPAALLADRIRDFVRASLEGAQPSESFGALALAIHEWQALSDPLVRALSGPMPSRWQDIPAVPVALFKHLPVGTATEGPVFRTSGTTGGGRGVHRMRSAELYNLGALGWAEACLPATPAEVVGLLVDPATHPDSSLSHMVALFEAWGGQATWHQTATGLDLEGLAVRMRSLDGPAFVGTTAFALAEWLDASPAALPEGSVLMVTGGFKGRVHRLEGEELYRETVRCLAPTHLVTEYGMTELSSQLWGTPESAYRPPPWLRAVAVDPETGVPRPDGEPGQLRFYDLCNLDSSVGIETLDEGIVGEDGAVTLFGRLPGSPARGCSLTAEEAWAARGGR
ncbi:MAG: hypothetical protein EP330_23715 [Deltaproteobacteria bacterium]|nr:MAG: hypothetical protein EP330_23715 [Deltaproteobacteria bacterium]